MRLELLQNCQNALHPMAEIYWAQTFLFLKRSRCFTPEGRTLFSLYYLGKSHSFGSVSLSAVLQTLSPIDFELKLVELSTNMRIKITQRQNYCHNFNILHAYYLLSTPLPNWRKNQFKMTKPHPSFYHNSLFFLTILI